MLKSNNISFQYSKGDFLFKNLSLEITPGEVVGLFGKSGSGKTTLAKIISGHLSPNDGELSINGETYPLDHKKYHPVQLIWQHAEKTINPKWQMKKVLSESNVDEELMRQFGIKKEWMNRFPSELSGGELQRFCLARAFGSETKYLVADEMTTMLDAITQAQIWQAVLPIAKERNIGILAISHQRGLLERISDRIINFDTLTQSS